MSPDLFVGCALSEPSKSSSTNCQGVEYYIRTKYVTLSSLSHYCLRCPFLHANNPKPYTWYQVRYSTRYQITFRVLNVDVQMFIVKVRSECLSAVSSFIVLYSVRTSESSHIYSRVHTDIVFVSDHVLSCTYTWYIINTRMPAMPSLAPEPL